MARSSLGIAACGLAAAAAIGIYTISKNWWETRKETKKAFKEEVKTLMADVMTSITNDEDIDDHPGFTSEGTGKAALDLLHRYAGDMPSIIRAERLADRRLQAVAAVNLREDPGSPKSPRGMQRPVPANYANDHTYNASAYKMDNNSSSNNACSPKRRSPNVVLHTNQAAERDNIMRSGPRWQNLQPQLIPTAG